MVADPLLANGAALMTNSKALRRIWQVEISQLESFTPAETAAVKSFLAIPDAGGFRTPYDASAKRQMTFISCTGVVDFLKPGVAGRRFLIEESPMPTTPTVDTTRLAGEIIACKKLALKAEELASTPGGGGDELVRTLLFLHLAAVKAMVSAERERR